MKDEFDEIINLFSLQENEKEEKLKEIFQLSLEFIERFKYMQHNGTEKEKKEIGKKLSLLREKISLEAQKSRNKLNLSKKEIEELSNKKENFTEEQWEMLETTKSMISSENATRKNSKSNLINKSLQQNKTSTKKIKTKSKRSSWLKS